MLNLFSFRSSLEVWVRVLEHLFGAGGWGLSFVHPCFGLNVSRRCSCGPLWELTFAPETHVEGRGRAPFAGCKRRINGARSTSREETRGAETWSRYEGRAGRDGANARYTRTTYGLWATARHVFDCRAAGTWAWGAAINGLCGWRADAGERGPGPTDSRPASGTGSRALIVPVRSDSHGMRELGCEGVPVMPCVSNPHAVLAAHVTDADEVYAESFRILAPVKTCHSRPGCFRRNPRTRRASAAYHIHIHYRVHPAGCGAHMTGGFTKKERGHVTHDGLLWKPNTLCSGGCSSVPELLVRNVLPLRDIRRRRPLPTITRSVCPQDHTCPRVSPPSLLPHLQWATSSPPGSMKRRGKGPTHQ